MYTDKAPLCQAGKIFLSLVCSFGWGWGVGGDFCFLPFKTSDPVKVEGTPGSCLFAICRWLCWPLNACSAVPRPLKLFYRSVICSLLPPHAPMFPLLSRSRSLFLSLSLGCFAWTPFHSSLFQDTAHLWRTSFHCFRNWYLRALWSYSQECVGLCWLNSSVQVNTACVSTWLRASGNLVKPSCLVNYRVTTTSSVTDFPVSGLAQWHENKLTQTGLFGLLPDLQQHTSKESVWCYVLVFNKELPPSYPPPAPHTH